MTALAGFWSFGGAETAARSAQMLKAQSVFGPDHVSQLVAGPIAVGRALYRRLPEDVHDAGPVVGGDGRLTLVADLRLDNRADLTAALDIPPDRARSLSDSQILMRALERWDDGAVDHIVGDFAFALWDSGRQRLLLARDFMGQRPLHYHSGDGFFAFASMPKGLHALSETPYAPRASAAADFLALLPETGAESFFEGVERVQPGHCLTVTRAGATTRRYWNPTRRSLRFKRDVDYADALRDQMDVAVRSRLRGAEGAVAAHLSAGRDSSTVAATAARLLAPGKLIAFTATPRSGWAAPRNAIGDEWPLAAATAALHDNIEHVRIGAESSPVAGLDRNFFLYERPLLNLCNATWVDAINLAAQRRGVRVMLTGQMGNMSISHTGLEVLPWMLKTGRLLPLAALCLALNRGGMRWRGLARQAIGPYLPMPVWRGLQRWFSGPPRLSQHSAIRPQAANDLGVFERAALRGWNLDARPWSDGFAMRYAVLGRVDLGNYNKGALAGWGIDYRDPTADRRLVEFCLSIPEEQFLLGGEPRSLVRRAFADRLPASVLNERRKGYQGADWGLALSAAREEVESELSGLATCAPAAAMLDLEAMQQAVVDWPAGDWDQPEVINRYRLSLLRGVSAGHFLRKATRSN